MTTDYVLNGLGKDASNQRWKEILTSFAKDHSLQWKAHKLALLLRIRATPDYSAVPGAAERDALYVFFWYGGKALKKYAKAIANRILEENASSLVSYVNSKA